MSKNKYKSIIKKKIIDSVFTTLKQKQEGHSKIKNIVYSEFKAQGYMKSHMLNNHETSLLFSLRSRTTKAFKANFPYHIDQMCPFGCGELDTPEHCLMCGKITREESQFKNTNYKDIFSQSVSKQVPIVQLIATLLERREVASALSTGPSHGPIQDNDSN